MKENSGIKWVSHFQGSTSTQTLDPDFKIKVESFIKELEAAGAKIIISSTLRPSERAYLMHWSWKLAKGLVKPEEIPEKRGVNIQWAHKNSDGKVDQSKSVQAAKEMVRAFGMTNLGVAPALKSRHTEGQAIDMDISWLGDLKIKNKQGESISINGFPRDGMNSELHNVGKTFGVMKYHGGSTDKPHWSMDGK